MRFCFFCFLFCIDNKLAAEKFEDTKGVIKRRKSKNDRQYNGQKEKGKMTNNDLRNNIQQIKIEEDDPAKRRKLAEVIVGGKLPIYIACSKSKDLYI